MKSLSKLVSLANRFTKYADEVDSSIVTLMVRPIANAIIEREAQELLMKLVAPVLQKTGGDVSLGGNFFTNARRAGSSWKVTNCTIDSKSTGNDAVDAAMTKVTTILVSHIVSALQAELAKKASLLVGDTITNHQTQVNSKEIGF